MHYVGLVNILNNIAFVKWTIIAVFDSPKTRTTFSSVALINCSNHVSSQEAAASIWTDGGCPPEKLIIGMPIYGRGFELADATDNGMDAPTVGSSPAEKYTREPGMLSYYEVSL